MEDNQVYIPDVECSACESCYELFGYQLAYIIRYVPREEAENKICHSKLKPDQVLIEYKCWDCGHINYEKIYNISISVFYVVFAYICS